MSTGNQRRRPVVVSVALVAGVVLLTVPHRRGQLLFGLKLTGYRINVLLQLCPTGKAVVTSDDMLSIGKFRNGNRDRPKAFNGRRLMQFKITQQIFGLFFEVFEVGLLR